MIGRVVLSGLLMAGLLLGHAASASVAVFVGRDLTADGSTLLGGFGDEPSSHWLSLVPARDHPAGATVPVGATAAADLPGELMKIPQVDHTYRYLSMDYSYFAGFPAPLTNGGMNEHGLAVRDVALFSRQELVDMTPRPQRGPQYSDLARLVLERARTAREAVDVAVELIERHGFTTYGGNSHVFADPQEGWVLLQMAGGQGLWVARRLGAGEIWLNWRGYHAFGFVQTLPADWRDHPDYLASGNFVDFAVTQGWHQPAPGKGLDVIATYARQDQYSQRTAREARFVAETLQDAAGEVGVTHLMELLHQAGMDSSGYGQVAHLRSGLEADLRTLWVAPGPPLTAAFVPWRIGVTGIPPEYRRHRYLTAGEAERQLIDSAQRGLESTRYVNRAVKRLLYLVEEHRQEYLPEVSSALSAFEAGVVAEQAAVERTARVLLQAGERELAQRYLTEHAHRVAEHGLELVEDLATGVEARSRVHHGVQDGAATP